MYIYIHTLSPYRHASQPISGLADEAIGAPTVPTHATNLDWGLGAFFIRRSQKKDTLKHRLALLHTHLEDVGNDIKSARPVFKTDSSVGLDLVVPRRGNPEIPLDSVHEYQNFMKHLESMKDKKARNAFRKIKKYLEQAPHTEESLKEATRLLSEFKSPVKKIIDLFNFREKLDGKCEIEKVLN